MTDAENQAQGLRASRDRVPPMLDGETTPGGTILDHPVTLTALSSWTALLVTVLIGGVVLRVARLDVYALALPEARWAYNAYALFTGQPLPNGEVLPTTAPFFLLLEAFAFFLFGVTDASARLAPAILGIGTLALIFALRPLLTLPRLLGVVVLAALSPTLVFASRTADPGIAVAFSTMLLVVALLRAGIASPSAVVGWSALAGAAVGAALASGPTSITALVAIAVGLVVAASTESDDEVACVRPALRSIRHAPGGLAAFVAGLIVSIVVLFTRLFTQLDAFAGLWQTVADWGRLMATQTTTTPVQLFFFVVLLYEILAVAFGLVAVLAPDRPGNRSKRPTVPASFLATWFVVALILQSFASGRSPLQALIVTLPLMLLGGLGLGMLFERVPWALVGRTVFGLIPLAVIGIAMGLIAIGMLFARANDPLRQTASTSELLIQVAFVLLLVILPLGYLIVELAARLRPAHRGRILGGMALLVLAVVLGAYTLRTSTVLAFVSADEGNELLAQRQSTEGVRAFVDQTIRLSRDASLSETSAEDATGSFGVSIALAPEVQWPYLWYFREFPGVDVIGPAGWGEADIVVANTEAGMAETGYVVDTFTSINRVPSSYQAPDVGTVFATVVSPGRWYSGIRYLLFRDLENQADPETIAVGRNVQLAIQLNPNAGPFDLFEQTGAGTGLGQFTGPTGVAASPDGNTIYVIDGGNQRIERFDRGGTFVGIWGGTGDPNLTLGFNFDQGASGITVDANGLIYVADTWTHRVVVLDESGRIVRELGQPGVPSDLQDSPDPGGAPGLFFGPRGVAVAGPEVYVTDTGNERVQVFATDGTFLRGFGGYGTGPGQFIEPTGIEIGPDGNVYVADSGNGRLSVFAKDGTPLTQIAIPSWAQQERRLNYLAFAPNGLLVMTAPTVGAVDVFDPATSQITFSFEGTEGVSLTAPTGVDILPDGAVIVADDGHDAVFSLTDDLSETVPSLPPASPPVATPVLATPQATPGRG